MCLLSAIRQEGVALSDGQFSSLTEERVVEVNEHIVSLLSAQGACVEGCVFCSFVVNQYVEKSRKRGLSVNLKYVVREHRDLKPNIGMIERACALIDRRIEECDVYFIGDRKSDVETGLNAGGVGILSASLKTYELGNVEKVKVMEEYGKRAFVFDRFSDSVDKVIELIAISS